MPEDENNLGYFKSVIKFYFSPGFRSFFGLLYLLFFFYFIIFYFDNVTLAIKFIIYTIGINTPLLDINYLFWGALFIIALVIPFTLSLYSVFLPYEISKHPTWKKSMKGLLIALIMIFTLDAVVALDYLVRYISIQSPIAPFIHEKGLDSTIILPR